MIDRFVPGSVVDRLNVREYGLAYSIVGLAAALVLPVMLDTYYTGILIDAMVLITFATGFNLLFGYTGLLSFGHAAFFGAGAYSVAILSQRLGFVNSLVPAIVLAIVVTAVVAGVIGVLSVQRSDIYFAMLTLAFNMMLYQAAVQFSNISGGESGLLVEATTVNLGLVSFPTSNNTLYYYFTFAVMALSLAVIWRITRSPYGELLAAIRENPDRAQFIGVPVKRYQWSAFVTSGAIGGLAGAVSAPRQFVITPGIMHWSASADPVLMTILGGPMVFFGPAAGAILFVVLEQVLTNITEHWYLGLGAILVTIVLFLPQGLVGTLVESSDRTIAEVATQAIDPRKDEEDSDE
jgi:branched-chain amino acid transport system permease protein